MQLVLDGLLTPGLQRKEISLRNLANDVIGGHGFHVPQSDERGEAVMEDEALQAVAGSSRGRVLLAKKARHLSKHLYPPVGELTLLFWTSLGCCVLCGFRKAFRVWLLEQLICAPTH